MSGRFEGFDWGITTRLVVIPQWLLVIPQPGKFKAPQSIIKKCVNTQVNICEEQLGAMDCFVVCYQKLRYKLSKLYHLRSKETIGVYIYIPSSWQQESHMSHCCGNMPGYISGTFHFWSIACMTSSLYYIQFNKCICNLTSEYSFNCGFKIFF